MDKKNVPLIVGIAIPILMILFVAASIYLPGLFAPSPKYNFLYITGGDYRNRDIYSVNNSRLVRNDIKYPENNSPRSNPKLFLHDTVKNDSREISFEDAQKLAVNSNRISPDGFEVIRGDYYYDFTSLFFGGGRNYRTWYIKGHNTSKKLNLQTDSYSYYHTYFIAWIMD